MIKSCTLLSTLVLASAASAQLQVSIGVRETGFAGGAFTTIGANGGATGGIEWVNRDGQTLVLDGTWQQFTFNLTTDPIVGFAGASANGTLEGAYGTIECVRLLNAAGVVDPIEIWIDDVANTTQSGGTTTFGTFSPYAHGTEVMFQEPTFSGSTSANIVVGATGGVDNFVASRSESSKSSFQFVDGTATRWLRLTTFNVANQGNPLIRFDDSAVVTFWMRGGKCQRNLRSEGPGPSIAELCGTGLNTSQTSTYYTANSQPFAAGAVAFSLANNIDIPFLGGNLVSFGGFVFSIGLNADANGRLSFPLAGMSNMLDVVIQTVYLDPSQTAGLAFTNAVQAAFGR